MMLWLFLNLLFFTGYHSTFQDIQEEKLSNLSEVMADLDIRHSLLDIGHFTRIKPPIVEWLTETDHDFQHLRQEHPKTFVFRFKNIDKEPILLQTVRTSCGCTAATWTETPIAPGDSGNIEVEYDAYQRGEFSKKIRVFFDRQRKPEILWIRGEVD